MTSEIDGFKAAVNALADYDNWVAAGTVIGSAEEQGISVPPRVYEGYDDEGCRIADDLADALRLILRRA